MIRFSSKYQIQNLQRFLHIKLHKLFIKFYIKNKALADKSINKTYFSISKEGK